MTYTKQQINDKIQMAQRFLLDSMNRDEFHVKNPQLEIADLNGCKVCLMSAAKMIEVNSE